MVDQFIGLILLGLGIKNQVGPQVKGDSVEVSQTANTENTVGTTDTNVLPNRPKGLRTDLRERTNIASRTARFDVEDLKTKIQEQQTKRKTEIEQKNAKFKLKLSEFKDLKKKEILSRLEMNFKEINDRRVTQLTLQLGKIQAILDKIIARAAALASAGKDTTNVNAVVATCRTDIAIAKDAITVQSGKVYSITLTTESAAKSSVGSTRQAMEADLKTVNASMRTARSCISDALKELAKISGNSEAGAVPSGTPTVAVTPTIVVPTAVPTL